MSYVQLSEGGFQAVYPLGLWSGSVELAKYDSDMARQVCTCTCTYAAAVVLWWMHHSCGARMSGSLTGWCGVRATLMDDLWQARTTGDRVVRFVGSRWGW